MPIEEEVELGHNRLPALAETIRSSEASIRRNARKIAEQALACGQALLEAKSLVPHGQWPEWLAANTGLSGRTAQRYMQLARSGMKSATVADLGIRGAAESLTRAHRQLAAYAMEGEQLGFVERGSPWWIGDWWLYGEKHYGACKATTEDPGWNGPSYEVCWRAARVCRAFEPGRRRYRLSFEHHEEVAHLPATEADQLLDWCERQVIDEPA